MTDTSIRNAVAKRETAPAPPSKSAVVRTLVDRNSGAIAASLPTGMNAERFARILITATNTTPALLQCDPKSFLAAGVMSAQLGLEPNDARGLAYLIPFGNKVQFIIGYKGMIELARRSGMVTTINAFPVFKGDEFDYSLGLEPTLRHIPGDHDENPDDLTHVYAVARIGGDPQFVVLTRRQIDKVMANSQGARSKASPWHTYYVEMALKSAIRRLCKMLPQSVEVARAMSNDDTTALSLGDFGLVTPNLERDDDDVIDIGDMPEIEPTSESDGIDQPQLG